MGSKSDPQHKTSILLMAGANSDYPAVIGIFRPGYGYNASGSNLAGWVNIDLNYEMAEMLKHELNRLFPERRKAGERRN